MDRFWSKTVTVEPEDANSCIRWIGSMNKKTGYGQFRHEGHVRGAHRVAYALTVGDPGPLQLDHLCRNRWCVNPAHLEPVSPRENTIRGAVATRGGTSPNWHGAMLARRQKVIQSGGIVVPRCGHEISTLEGLDSNGGCKVCRQERMRKYYRREG